MLDLARQAYNQRKVVERRGSIGVPQGNPACLFPLGSHSTPVVRCSQK